MISIIICSRKADIPQELKDNIAATIGCDYELCVIDNSRNEYNIFTAYNEGVRRANGDILCFMHEDLLFHTTEWGISVQRAFEKEKQLGALGIVGGQYLGDVPCAWWDASPKVGRLLQGYTNKEGLYTITDDNEGSVECQTEVVALDGCFICIKKELFNKIRWDDNLYHGFHLYDMDICLQILSVGYKVMITPDVLIEHKSIGNADMNWRQALDVFYRKWQDNLPIWRGVILSSSELKWRERLLNQFKTAEDLERRLDRIETSKAYKLGKALLKPFKWLTKK